MITFYISNIIPEGNQIRVFYQFSNGDCNSNLFNTEVSQEELDAWGNERVAFFEWLLVNPPLIPQPEVTQWQ